MRRSLRQNILNIPGWTTKRKIIVFESDDWGSIRSESANSLEILRSNSLKVDKCHYMMNDSLASELDLQKLFDLLVEYTDYNGRHPVITANCLVANPDFRKIEESNYIKYYFESFKTTLANYPNHKNSFQFWQKGMNLNIFHPQFHGREHLNVHRWMKDLQDGNEETLLAFKLGMFGISGHVSNNNRGSYLAAFDGNSSAIYEKQVAIVKDGLSLFKSEFGYNSKSLIAPNYIWNDKIESIASEYDVEYIQGTNTQRISKNFGEKTNVKRHYLGQKNKYNQYYLIRNCIFEPSENPKKNWVDSCLKEIEISFRWKKPAVIATHRVNFVGFINPLNRDVNLGLFKKLLSTIVRKWPDVEFMSSDQLGDLISKNEK